MGDPSTAAPSPCHWLSPFHCPHPEKMGVGWGGFTARGLWGDLGQILQLTWGFGHQCTAWMGLTHKLTHTQAQPLLSQPPFSPYPPTPPRPPPQRAHKLLQDFFPGQEDENKAPGGIFSLLHSSALPPARLQRGFLRAPCGPRQEALRRLITPAPPHKFKVLTHTPPTTPPPPHPQSPTWASLAKERQEKSALAGRGRTPQRLKIAKPNLRT